MRSESTNVADFKPNEHGRDVPAALDRLKRGCVHVWLDELRELLIQGFYLVREKADAPEEGSHLGANLAVVVIVGQDFVRRPFVASTGCLLHGLVNLLEQLVGVQLDRQVVGRHVDQNRLQASSVFDKGHTITSKVSDRSVVLGHDRRASDRTVPDALCQVGRVGVVVRVFEAGLAHRAGIGQTEVPVPLLEFISQPVPVVGRLDDSHVGLVLTVRFQHLEEFVNVGFADGFELLRQDGLAAHRIVLDLVPCHDNHHVVEMEVHPDKVGFLIVLADGARAIIHFSLV